MTKKIRFHLVFFFILFLFGDLFCNIDHIRFGSLNDPLNGLTITWRGNYSHSYIRWGYSPNFECDTVKIEGRIEFGNDNHYLYDYTFPSLKPDVDIYYSLKELTGSYDPVQYEGEWSEVLTYHTSTDLQSHKFSFIAGGDSRGDAGDFDMETWGEMSDILSVTHADFYLFVGDLSLVGGNRLLWDTWYRAGGKFISKKLIYHCAGNHERYGDPELDNYRNQFVLPENGNFSETYYSFEFGNAVFIVLNTEFNKNKVKGYVALHQQNRWLADQLKKYRGSKKKDFKEWVIISFHKPLFTIDKHMGEMTGGEKPGAYYNDFSSVWWKDLFDRYGVDVILNGHTHLYMRTTPIRLVGTGEKGRDIVFDKKGMPSKPSRKVEYGNKKGQGRLQVISGGYGAPLKEEGGLDFKDQWYVDNYKLDYHYCEFFVDGKELIMKVKRLPDGEIIDHLTITH